MSTQLVANTAGERWLDRIATWLAERPWRDSVMISIAALAAALLGDVLTPERFNFGPVYSAAVGLAAWLTGRRGGYFAAAFATLVVASPLEGGPDAAALLWTAATRGGFYILIAAVFGTMRRTYDQQHALARTDGLTGALNRRAFQEAITAMLRRARRQGDSIVVSYSDLDGFKAVNDTYGHAVGDAVLAAFATAARAELDGDDALARVGGDEFVMIQLADADDDLFGEAEARHERLTASLAALPYQVTCSMGVVIARGGRTDEARLVAFADALLYEVKRAGKNALRIAEAGLADAQAA